MCSERHPTDFDFNRTWVAPRVVGPRRASVALPGPVSSAGLAKRASICAGAWVFALSCFAISQQAGSQAGAPARPEPATPVADHEVRSRSQSELVSLLDQYPIDRDRVLAQVRQLRGSLTFPLHGRCGDTPIVYAARRSDLDLVRSILDSGVGIDDRLDAPPDDGASRENWSCPGSTALMGSVGFADEEESAARNSRLEATGKSELARRLRELDDPEKHVQLTRFLLDRRANVNLKSGQEGVTSLVLALRGHHRKAAKLLLERGASADVRREVAGSRVVPDEIVILQGNDWSILSLTLTDAIRAPEVSVNPEDLQLARLALSHGAGQRDKDRVLEAAFASHQSIVAGLLLQSGANPNLQTAAGRFGRVTLLARALEDRRWDDAALLLQSGASPNACARESAPGQCDLALVPTFLPSTRIFISAMLQGAPPNLLRLMLDKGADIQVVDQTGRTALESANGSCFLKDGRLMTGSRCPLGSDPPAGFDRERMTRFLLDNGAVARAESGAASSVRAQAGPEPPKLPAPASGAGRSRSHAGRLGGAVLDVASGQPIAGVVVVVDWRATASGMESREVCLHTDAARSDAAGHYEMDDWSGYSLFLYDRKRRISAFKFGYELAVVKDQTVYMKSIPASGDRWRVVEPCYIDFGDDTRAEFRKTRRDFFPLYATMATDLATAADNPTRRSVLERLQHQAESCRVDYSKPVMLNRYGLDANVDPKDALRPPADP